MQGSTIPSGTTRTTLEAPLDDDAATGRCAAATRVSTAGSSSRSPRLGSTAGRAAPLRPRCGRVCAFSRPRPRPSGLAFAPASGACRTQRPARRSGTGRRRCGRASDAPHRRRRRRPRRRAGPRPSPRLQRTASQPNAARRGRCGTAGPGAGPACPDGADPARDDRAASRRDRVRSRVLERAPIQRHDPGSLRARTDGAPSPFA